MSTHALTIDCDYGVPTVALHTDMFTKVVESVAMVKGVPEAPKAFVPQPVMGKSTDELKAYIYGDDPVTGRPVMQEVIEGLTKALDAKPMPADRSTPRLVEPDTEENLRQLFMDNYWTDFLPIVLPTEKRVAAMLAGTSRKPDEIVGRMQPTSNRGLWEYDVEKVAVNAVMAGAKPEYFPVILALASSGVSARGSTTSSAAAMAVVNGPVREQIGMNWGIGAMGPHNHANATIGRAYSLLSQNLQGGSIAGETFMGSQGNAYCYASICFAENEDCSPWEPLHVTKGFEPEDSAVSIFYGNRSSSFCLGVREKEWEQHVTDMLTGIDANTPPVFVLDPLTVKEFVDIAGIKTKQELIDWAFDHARMRASAYWDLQLIQNYVLPRATFGEEPFATKLEAAPDEMINTFRHEDINVVVVGGETNAYWTIKGAGYRGTFSVDEWR